ncbi:T9SS type A sorting domain-containing protein [Hymenobacter sp. BT683]|uniref:T9SS type A sorting domain-containing protein n=1 Tax=Hymenobacter jeongseonensis TaxID=2791027 RepID=A0ABS0INE8_9BACT|nr:T9SS type A sorting domain-containing protein [Hymenobacter jeongseonensis]MBF9239712.1 T9SS type A sorting domain-containing protein [Hymenobacter jeongseonensis]
MQTFFNPLTIRNNYLLTLLLGTFVLLLGSPKSFAQIYFKTQNFNALYTPPATGNVLGFSATGGTYFNNSFNAIAGNFGTYGVANSGNGLTGTSATITFDPQAFQASSLNNTLSFQIGSITTATNQVGFGNNSSIRVTLAFTNTRTLITTTSTLLINPASGNGPTYLAGATTAASRTFTSTGSNSLTTIVPANGLTGITINLPSFTDVTTVGVSIVINTSRRNVLVIDNVTLASVSPLPVELTHFEATAKPQGVVLNWATATEKNNDRFEVQRSANGETFQTIGAVKGQGNSSNSQAYSFADSRPLAGQSYYRLRQVDTDGASAFSPVVTVQIHSEARVYPNPTTDAVMLPATLGPVQYRILNALGQTMLSGNATGNERLDLTRLNKGTYFLELIGTTERSSQRVVRE